MPRIILNKDSAKLDINTKSTVSKGYITDGDVLKKRTQKYINLITGLDSKTITDTKGMNDLIIQIQEEFGAADLGSLPLGIVSKCFLGHPYEVHTLHLGGSQIIKHYRTNEKMESDFEKARTLAKHNAYAMVEVYKDKVVLIHEDGSATEL